MQRLFSTLLIVGSDLHHCSGAVGVDCGAAVGFSQTGVAAEDVGTAVFTAEDYPLGEDGAAVQGCGTAGAHHGIC